MWRVFGSDDNIPVVTLGCVDDVLLEGPGESLQVRVGEAGADFAERLELLGVGVVAGQQEPPEDAGALAAAPVPAHHHRVDGVSHAVQVVLLELPEKRFNYKFALRRGALQSASE